MVVATAILDATSGNSYRGGGSGRGRGAAAAAAAVAAAGAIVTSY